MYNKETQLRMDASRAVQLIFLLKHGKPHRFPHDSLPNDSAGDGPDTVVFIRCKGLEQSLYIENTMKAASPSMTIASKKTFDILTEFTKENHNLFTRAIYNFLF